MKILTIIATLALSVNAFAMDFPSGIPSSGSWAKAMTKKACGLKSSDLKDATGTITKVDGGGVIYMVSENGNLIAAASAEAHLSSLRRLVLTNH